MLAKKQYFKNKILNNVCNISIQMLILVSLNFILYYGLFSLVSTINNENILLMVFASVVSSAISLLIYKFIPAFFSNLPSATPIIEKYYPSFWKPYLLYMSGIYATILIRMALLFLLFSGIWYGIFYFINIFIINIKGDIFNASTLLSLPSMTLLIFFHDFSISDIKITYKAWKEYRRLGKELSK